MGLLKNRIGVPISGAIPHDQCAGLTGSNGLGARGPRWVGPCQNILPGIQHAWGAV